MTILSFITKILHYLPGELSHAIALRGLKLLHLSGLMPFFYINDKKYDFIQRDIRFRTNMLGIAAGLDKNGDYIDSLASLGIGFIELGTVTPKPQKGNPKPRIFRNREEKYLINRLGFNNKGVDYLVKKLKKRKSEIIVGSSIGKNFDTPNNKAHEDYIHCLEKVYEYSDYADKEGNAINFESYMVAEDDLEEGQLRLLEVDNRVVLPTNTHLRVLVTASDVLHCWAVPSLGVKIDACPGRLNQVSMFIKREGVFYGQCSEICGINHGFMPIVVEAVPVEKYVSWVAAQTECENWLVDKITAIQSLNSSAKK